MNIKKIDNLNQYRFCAKNLYYLIGGNYYGIIPDSIFKIYADLNKNKMDLLRMELSDDEKERAEKYEKNRYTEMIENIAASK